MCVHSSQYCFCQYLVPCPVNVESESAYEPQRLPLESVRIMREKIATLREAALSLTTPDGGEDQMAVDS